MVLVSPTFLLDPSVPSFLAHPSSLLVHRPPIVADYHGTFITYGSQAKRHIIIHIFLHYTTLHYTVD
jgi:hypothetical protein